MGLRTWKWMHTADNAVAQERRTLNNDWRLIIDSQQEAIGPEWKARERHVDANSDHVRLRREGQSRKVTNSKLNEREIRNFLTVEDSLIAREILQE
jgi:hypothetical protein